MSGEKIHLRFAGWAGVLLMLTPLLVSAAGLYRWTDAKGVVHFGNTLPPSAAQGESVQLNARGEVRRVYPAAESAAQRAADQQARERIQSQKAYDQSLLQTYSSVHDIEQARDQQLALVDKRIALAARLMKDDQKALAKVQKALVGHKANAELQQSRQDDALAVNKDRATIADLNVERTATVARYQHAIKRYRQLQAADPQAPTSTSSP